MGRRGRVPLAFGWEALVAFELAMSHDLESTSVGRHALAGVADGTRCGVVSVDVPLTHKLAATFAFRGHRLPQCPESASLENVASGANLSTQACLGLLPPSILLRGGDRRNGSNVGGT